MTAQNAIVLSVEILSTHAGTILRKYSLAIIKMKAFSVAAMLKQRGSLAKQSSGDV
jgi:hypothetical protein